MEKKLVPVGDNFIVEPIEDETTTASGIVLPDTITKEKPRKGRVISVGEGKRDDTGKLVPMPAKIDDVIVFTQYAPTEIKIQGKEYYIVGASSVLALEK